MFRIRRWAEELGNSGRYIDEQRGKGLISATLAKVPAKASAEAAKKLVTKGAKSCGASQIKLVKWLDIELWHYLKEAGKGLGKCKEYSALIENPDYFSNWRNLYHLFPLPTLYGKF